MTDRIIKGPECLIEGATWLASVEPRFAEVLPSITPLPLRLKDDGFGPLLHIILGQQVSVASAQAVWEKLETAGLNTPDTISAASPDDLRAMGLSRQKAAYAIGLAAAGIDFDGLRDRSNADVIKTLRAVKGIGSWTAEVYTMFSLGRADIFAPGDLAIQEAARIIYDLPNRPTERAMRDMAQAWSPWRSVAARIFWAYYAMTKKKDGII